jgi:excisionase family DNA binding protein
MFPPVEAKLTTADVARLLGLRNIKTVQRYVKRGVIRAYRIGKDFRFTASDVAIFQGKARLND